MQRHDYRAIQGFGMRVVTLIAIALWPAIAGAVALFLVNGLGSSGAFAESPALALRSLRIAAAEGFEFGVKAGPFLSLGPAAFVFSSRKWRPLFRDIEAAACGGVTMFVLFLAYISIVPVDPLVGGIVIPIGFVVIVTSGVFTGLLIAWLRPRVTPLSSPP